VFIEAKDDEGGGDNWTTGAISRVKLQSNHHHQQTNIQLFYRPDGCPFVKALKYEHIPKPVACWQYCIFGSLIMLIRCREWRASCKGVLLQYCQRFS